MERHRRYAPWQQLEQPQFAPAGRKLAMDIFDGQEDEVWVYEWARDTLTRLTFDHAASRKPVWTPDGKRIAFASNSAKGAYNLYWQRADGTGEIQRLTDSTNAQVPGSWHASGKYLASQYQRFPPSCRVDRYLGQVLSKRWT